MWVENCAMFLDYKIQPILEKAEYSVNTGLEFSYALEMLILEKLAADIPCQFYDDALFYHLLYKVPLLRYSVHSYLSSFPSFMHIL